MPETTKIEPALTAEVLVPEVKHYLNRSDPDWRMFNWDRLVREWGPHSGAALLLHGQPFGFTWEDVDTLDFEQSAVGPEDPGAADRLRSIMHRIAALLPPRPEETE